MPLSRKPRRRATVLLLILLLAAVPLASYGAPLQPDDPLFSQQWNLFTPDAADQGPTPDIQAPLAWDITTGIPNTIIAVLDTGVDLDHPDLGGKIWVNADEIPDNGIDDDGNGYVDDVHGWDFVDGDNLPDDPDGFGTFGAGVAAAATDNGVGIAGIAWRALVMPLRVRTIDDQGRSRANVDDVVAAMDYAREKGARILQFGFYWIAPVLDETARQKLQGAIERAHAAGMLIVAPVGDDAQSGNPAPYPAALSHVLGVTATDRNGDRLEASGFGTFVDLAAPGGQVLGLSPSPPYWTTAVGTEFAVPHVTATAALIWAANPTLTPDEVADLLTQTADDRGPLGRDEFYGFGLLNAALALQETPHWLQVTPLTLRFQVDEMGVVRPPTGTILNPNTGGRTWRATTQTPWLIIEGLTETTPSFVSVSIDRRKIPNCGTYQGEIVVESTQRRAENSPQVVSVVLEFARSRCAKVFLPLLSRSRVSGLTSPSPSTRCTPGAVCRPGS